MFCMKCYAIGLIQHIGVSLLGRRAP